MVSVGVSKLGCTDLFFVEPGVKINVVYYCDVMHKLLPVVGQISGNKFVFQQDSAPAHRARETIIELFISPEQWPSNSPDLNPVDYKIWVIMQQQSIEMLTNCDSVCRTFGAALNKTSSTHPLTSGVCDSKHACVRQADILNTCCKLSA